MTKTIERSEDPNTETRFLILMRHAKSDWGDDTLSDHDRPLNPRGRRDAPRMAQWLSEVDMVPDLILSSASERTRETVSLMSGQWSTARTALFSETLYLATPESIIESINHDGGDASRLLVLAHNPGMAHLVSVLSNQFVDMPTAAIAIFQTQRTDWSDFQSDDSMSLVHYMRPKAL